MPKPLELGPLPRIRKRYVCDYQEIEAYLYRSGQDVRENEIKTERLVIELDVAD